MGGEELYILKHKDLDTAMVKINPFSGRIEYILEVYLPEELPVGCKKDGTGLAEWWNMRAVPDTRKGIQQALKILREETSQSLMLAAYGLSLTDHYWMQPVSKELYWRDINFFENDFWQFTDRYWQNRCRRSHIAFFSGFICKWRDEEKMDHQGSYPLSAENKYK